jgi:hypothetical protein
MVDVIERASDGDDALAEHEYAAHEHRPLKGYLAVEAAYGAFVAGLGLLGRRRRVQLPEHIGAADLALLSVATHRVSRTLAKDPVASPLRAPFTRFKGVQGPAELREEVVGTGARKAVGELVTCPFCLGQWVATGFMAGMVFAPRATRLLASTFAVVAASDALQFAYSALQESAE